MPGNRSGEPWDFVPQPWAASVTGGDTGTKAMIQRNGQVITGRPLGEVVIEHVPVGLPPATARVLEVAYQFLLLGIHADDRQSVREIPPADTGQVAELPVPVRVVRPGPTFPVGPQRVVVLVEQPGDALSTDGDPLTP